MPEGIEVKPCIFCLGKLKVSSFFALHAKGR
jgi:hypothetical protein